MKRAILAVGILIALFAAALWWRKDGTTVAPMVAGKSVDVSMPVAADSLQGETRPEPAARRAQTVTPDPVPVASPANRPDATSPKPDNPRMQPPIDRDQALDLFAQRIAKLERDESGEDSDIQAAREQRRFKARADGGDASLRLEQTLSDRVNDQLAALAPDLADRLALIAVECRTGACRILIAQSGVDFQARQISNESSDTARVQGALFALANQAWWGELGLGFGSLGWSAAGGDNAANHDYALWTIYVSAPEPFAS